MGWEGRMVLVFAGEVRSWEAFDGITTFFKEVQTINPAAYLALFAYGDLNPLQEMIWARQVPSDTYCLKTLAPAKIPLALGSSDVGLLLRQQDAYTSGIHIPIKFAEYLAAGLPVVLTPGISDTEQIIRKYKAGIVVDLQQAQAFRVAAAQLVELVNNDAELHQRCRMAAEMELGLDRAVAAYHQVYQMIAEMRKQR
jgi:glycosyltransferase involved in cell wall biosynthesis